MNVFDNKKITKESLINHLPISIYNSLQEAFYSAKTRIPKKFFIVPNLGEKPRTCSASFQHIKWGNAIL